MLQQFLTILERTKEKEIIPFLQALSDDDKRKLVPDLKKTAKDYLEYREVRTGLSTQYKIKANDQQKNILVITAFVCCNRAEFEKIIASAWLLEQKLISRVIDWYCPSWFNDFINKLGEAEFLPYSFSYEWIVELTQKGFLNPTKQLIVKLLPQFIFENKDRVSFYKPENVLKYSITMDEHIWYLFEVESNVHVSERWLHFAAGVNKERVGWIELFVQYTAEGKIERSRILPEALLASNRNFNKILSGWFCDLLLRWNPQLKKY